MSQYGIFCLSSTVMCLISMIVGKKSTKDYLTMQISPINDYSEDDNVFKIDGNQACQAETVTIVIRDIGDHQADHGSKETFPVMFLMPARLIMYMRKPNGPLWWAISTIFTYLHFTTSLHMLCPSTRRLINAEILYQLWIENWLCLSKWAKSMLRNGEESIYTRLPLSAISTKRQTNFSANS